MSSKTNRRTEIASTTSKSAGSTTGWDESYESQYRVESEVRAGLDSCDSVKDEESRLSKHLPHLIAYCDAQEEEPSWVKFVRRLNESSTPEEKVEVCKQLQAADDFPDEAANCLLWDECVQVAKAEIAEEHRQELLDLVTVDSEVGRLDPHLTIPSVFGCLVRRRYVERKICGAMREFGDRENESLLKEDSDEFWERYRLGYLQLLEICDPPLEPWTTDIVASASIACGNGPQIRRFAFQGVCQDGAVVDLPTFVDLSHDGSGTRLATNHSVVNLEDVFLRMSDECRVALCRGRSDCISLQVGLITEGDAIAVRMDLIKDPSLI